MNNKSEQIDERCVVQPRLHDFDEKCVVMARYHSRETMTICAICRTQPERAKAKFCAVCGHDLRMGYAPLDVLRASYNLQDQTLQRQNYSEPTLNESTNLFVNDNNSAASTAAAFAIYSLVPYLGILFSPGALAFGCFGLAISLQKPEFGGRQTSLNSILFGSIILVIQILLWCLLYFLPELNK